MPFLPNIEWCPKFLEFALLVLSIKLFQFYFQNKFLKYLNKLVENHEVTQPKQNQVIKVKSVQSFRDAFKTQLKILAFVY